MACCIIPFRGLALREIEGKKCIERKRKGKEKEWKKETNLDGRRRRIFGGEEKGPRPCNSFSYTMLDPRI